MSLIPFAGAVQKFNRQRGGYQIERSLRFNSADSAYLNRTPASAGNRKTWTWSGWVKRGSLATGASQVLFNSEFATSASRYLLFRFLDTNVLQLFGGIYTTGASTTTCVEVSTSAVFRDVSAWYHIVCTFDTTQATSSNRTKIYVNGVQQTLTGTFPSLNDETFVNATNLHTIGNFASLLYYDGYLTDINFIDGSALDPTSFGEFNTDTGVWQPKAYTGSYGTNGFYLDFSDNSGTTSTTLGKDSSGNGNNWTPNNFSVTAGAGNDSLVDTPTPYGTDTGAGGEVRGNYATLNAVRPSTATLSEGNLKLTATTAAAWANRLSTIGMREGKWYCEFTIDLANSPFFIGIADEGTLPTQYIGQSAGSWGYYGSGGTVWNNASSSALGASYTTGDLIGIAFNADSGQLTFYKNGVSQGTVSSIPSGQYFFAFSGTSVSTAGTANFGQRPFAYTAPSGFKALCTQNLPEPTIVDGSQYFNTVLYTGTGSSLGVTGVGFQPDLVWGKSRSNAISHVLGDVLRGGSRALFSNLTDAEDFSSGNYVASFDSDGFTTNGTGLNTSGATYVAWNWKAGNSNVTNTDGTITSTVRANPTAGFSIVTYTGTGANATVGHGLGVAPSMVIIKKRNGAEHWGVWHIGLSANNVIWLDSTDAQFNPGTNYFADNNPVTSSLLNLETNGPVNASGGTYVAYCFASIPGYSAFGSYTGNGSADGPFVYTGFRPAFVMWKNASASQAWLIEDAARSPFNQVALELYPSSSGAEAAGSSRSPTQQFDYLSNGFKVRGAQEQTNGSGNTIIYAAFSEAAFKYSLAR